MYFIVYRSGLQRVGCGPEEKGEGGPINSSGPKMPVTLHQFLFVLPAVSFLSYPLNPLNTKRRLLYLKT
jgi:hypothetical protein